MTCYRSGNGRRHCPVCDAPDWQVIHYPDDSGLGKAEVVYSCSSHAEAINKINSLLDVNDDDSKSWYIRLV